jgi:hypothetical protein
MVYRCFLKESDQRSCNVFFWEQALEAESEIGCLAFHTMKVIGHPVASSFGRQGKRSGSTMAREVPTSKAGGVCAAFSACVRWRPAPSGRSRDRPTETSAREYGAPSFRGGRRPHKRVKDNWNVPCTCLIANISEEPWHADRLRGALITRT